MLNGTDELYTRLEYRVGPTLMLNGTDELYTRLEYVGPTLMLLHDITTFGHGLVLFISINRTKWRTDAHVCLLNASILDRSTCSGCHWMDGRKKYFYRLTGPKK